MPILVVVTCALVAVVAVVAVPRTRAPEPTPPPVREEEPERPRIECVMPDPALDADAVAEREARVAAHESAVEALLHDLVVAQVEDNGPGVPEGVDPFEAFFTSKSNGTGLGLWVSRTLAERAGGTLDLVPSASGATFCLRLPAKTG